jgi:predicted nucleic acid-binding protein
VSLPDPDDEPIVASALAGKAQVFVTGDKALLELGSVEDLPIVSPRQFWEMLAVGR